MKTPWKLLKREDSPAASSPDPRALEDPGFRRALEAYDRYLEDEGDRNSVAASRDRSRSAQLRFPLIRLKRVGRAKHYRVTGVIEKDKATKERRKELRHSRYWTYLLFAFVMLALLALFYLTDPLPKIQEFFSALGY